MQITEESRKRKRSSKRQDCPVYIRIAVIKSNSLVWTVRALNLEHNHNLLAADEIDALSQHRVMSQVQSELVDIMHNSGARTQAIVTAVNMMNGGFVLPKDVVNKCARIKQVKLDDVQ